jgi:hypothetical protein
MIKGDACFAAFYLFQVIIQVLNGVHSLLFPLEQVANLPKF